VHVFGVPGVAITGAPGRSASSPRVDPRWRGGSVASGSEFVARTTSYAAAVAVW
jgi:hypothetical protein